MGGVEASGSAAASAAGPLEVGVASAQHPHPALSTPGFRRAPTRSPGNTWPPWLGPDRLLASAPSLAPETQALPESSQTLSGPAPHGDGLRRPAPPLASSKPHVPPACPVAIGQAPPCWGRSHHLTPVHAESMAAARGHPGQALPGAGMRPRPCPPGTAVWGAETGRTRTQITLPRGSDRHRGLDRELRAPSGRSGQRGPVGGGGLMRGDTGGRAGPRQGGKKGRSRGGRGGTGVSRGPVGNWFQERQRSLLTLRFADRVRFARGSAQGEAAFPTGTPPPP